MAAKETNLDLAEKLLKAMPKAIRDESQVVEKPGKPYSILKVRGASIASVRDGAVRIVHRVDAASADDVKRFAALLAEVAPAPKPEPKKPAAKDDAPAEGEKGGDE